MNIAVNYTTNSSSVSCLITEEKWFTSVIMFITLVLGLIGNILVLLIVVKRKKERTENDIFIANLAISDLALLLVFLPAKLYAFLNCDRRVYFAAFCTLVYPMAVLTFSTSIFTMTAMSIHRCRHIVSPFLPPAKRLYTYIWIALIWALSIGTALPLMIFTKLDPEVRLCKGQFTDVMRKTYTAVLFVLQSVIPLSIICGAYYRIWRDLSRSVVQKASLNRRGQVTTDCNRSENKQVVITIATIVIVFVICTFPTQVAWMANDFGDEKAKEAADVIFKFSDILAMFHSCVNPIVYGSLTKHFRHGYYRYLCYLRVKSSKKAKSKSRSSVGNLAPRSYITENAFKMSCNINDNVVTLNPLVSRGNSKKRPVVPFDDVIEHAQSLRGFSTVTNPSH